MKKRMRSLVSALIIFGILFSFCSMYPAYAAEKNDVEGTGWVRASGKWYYIRENGKKTKGWLEDGDSWYYLNAKGVMQKGWQQISGKWYYFRDNGQMQTGWKSISGKLFYFGTNGIMKTGWVKWRNDWYFFSEKGIMQTGWVQYKDGWYYMDQDGKLCSNRVLKSRGDVYYLDENGRALTSDFYTVGDKLYYADENGITRKEEGCLTVNGKKYYSDSKGVFYTSQYITVNGEKFFVDKTGARIKGKPTIDQYLKCEDLYEFMVSHFNDFYFKTPYRGLSASTQNHQERLIMPYGLYGEDAGMNCTGFISSLVSLTGGDLSLVAAMGEWGGYGNANNYRHLAFKGLVKYETFNSVSELLKSGKAKKGNICYLEPDLRYGGDCHMVVFWGDTSSENKVWSQRTRTLCNVTEFGMGHPIGRIYMFPIEHNLTE